MVQSPWGRPPVNRQFSMLLKKRYTKFDRWLSQNY